MITSVLSNIKVGTPIGSANPIKTLSDGFKDWCKANGGVTSINTFSNITYNWNKWVLPTLGENTIISNISSADVNMLIKTVKLGVSMRTVMTVYYSTRTVFEFFVDQGYVSINVAEAARKKYGWYIARYVQGAAINSKDIQHIVEKMLDVPKNFYSLRAVLFAYLAYFLQKAPGILLMMKWGDPALLQLDALGQKLVLEYKLLQANALAARGLSNPNSFVFTSLKGSNGQVSLAFRSFGQVWMRKNVFAPLGLKKVSVNAMRRRKASRDGLKVYDPSKSYLIFQ